MDRLLAETSSASVRLMKASGRRLFPWTRGLLILLEIEEGDALECGLQLSEEATERIWPGSEIHSDPVFAAGGAQISATARSLRQTVG